jgi:uncharacterized protein
MKIELYEDVAGEWRWRLRGANGEPMADSGEGYTRKEDARRALATLQASVISGDLAVAFAHIVED